MPHRDPETGQFVASGESFDDIETVSFFHREDTQVVAAGDFEAITLVTSVIDMDDLLDRRRDEGVLLYAKLRASVTNPLQDVHAVASHVLQTDDSVILNAPGTGGGITVDDSQDVIGAPTMSDILDTAAKPIQLGEMEVTREETEDPLFHPRDEIFLAHGIWVGNASANDAVHRIHAVGKLQFGVRTT